MSTHSLWLLLFLMMNILGSFCEELFFLAALKFFCLSLLTFFSCINILTIMSLGSGPVYINPLRVCWASWMSRLIFFIRFYKVFIHYFFEKKCLFIFLFLSFWGSYYVCIGAFNGILAFFFSEFLLLLSFENFIIPINLLLSLSIFSSASLYLLLSPSNDFFF